MNLMENKDFLLAYPMVQERDGNKNSSLGVEKKDILNPSFFLENRNKTI